MITIIYDEKEKDMILQASGHAGYAEKGSDIVCAAVSALMQTLAYSVDGGTVTRSQDDCNTLTVQAEQSFDNMAKFELVTDGLMLLAKQYPENMRFVNLHANDTDNVDLQLFAATATTAACGGNREELLGQRPAGHECRSRHEVDAGSRNPWGTFMLQLFAEGEAAPPALSEAQTRQAVASGTMKPDEAKVPAAPQASAEKTVELQPEKPRQELPVQRPELPPLSSFARSTQAAVHSLHARWAAEEAAMRRSQPDFDLQNELRSPEMRRLMQLPGMRVRDAYRLAHYDENLRTAAQAVEQGVVERIQQRAARPTENGIRPGGAATVRPDVASMTRAQREALERRVLHGAQIEL